MLKADKYPGEPSSYRLISLLDTIGKMLEGVIYDRLLPVIESHGSHSNQIPEKGIIFW